MAPKNSKHNQPLKLSENAKAVLFIASLALFLLLLIAYIFYVQSKGFDQDDSYALILGSITATA